MIFKVGDIAINGAGQDVTITQDTGNGLVGYIDGEGNLDYSYEGHCIQGSWLLSVKESATLTPAAPKPISGDDGVFNVGDTVQIGTEEFPPGGDDKPWVGRVICNDFISNIDLPVLVAVKKHNNAYESILQFSSEGLCFLAIKRNGPNDWHYKDQNCYLI